MKAINRREFLTGSFLQSREKSLSETGGAAVTEPGPDFPARVMEKLSIGRVADFPPGVTHEIESLRLESLPEGLRARDRADARICFAIETEPGGRLVVDRTRRWPENSVYSFLTNERDDLTSSWEEQA